MIVFGNIENKLVCLGFAASTQCYAENNISCTSLTNSVDLLDEMPASYPGLQYKPSTLNDTQLKLNTL